MPYDYAVVDSHLMAYRNWWPVRQLKTPDGVPSGMEFGFGRGVHAVSRIWEAKVVLVWDGIPVRCNTIFPQVIDDKGVASGYKSGRQKHKDKREEPDWTPRLETLRRVWLPLTTTLYDPEAEADEEIARFVFWAESKNRRSLIISKDRDLHQLVSDKTHLIMGSEDTDLYTPERVLSEWGVPSSKLPFRRAVEGDSSDAYAGISRYPKDLIVNLANDSTSIEDLLSRIGRGNYSRNGAQLDKLLNGRDVISRNYQLSQLTTQCQYKPTILPGTFGISLGVKQFYQDLGCSESFMNRKEWEILEQKANDLSFELDELKA